MWVSCSSPTSRSPQPSLNKANEHLLKGCFECVESMEEQKYKHADLLPIAEYVQNVHNLRSQKQKDGPVQDCYRGSKTTAEEKT